MMLEIPDAIKTFPPTAFKKILIAVTMQFLTNY